MMSPTCRLPIICLMGLLLSGCKSEPPVPDGPPPRQQVVLPKLSVPEIGKNALGPALHSATVEGSVAHYAYTPKLDDTPEKNFARMIQLGALPVLATFRDQPEVKTIRLTAVDPADASKALLVWTMTRDASRKVDWSHGATADKLLTVSTVEKCAPEYQAFTTKITGKGGEKK